MKHAPLHDSLSTRHANQISVFLAALTIFSSKLILISSYAGAMPFWDQWDGEWVSLYKPYLEGNLRIVDLFVTHNEHTIFFSKLLALANLEIRGAWDPMFQMLMNITLQCLAIGILITQLARSLNNEARNTMLAISVAFLLVPVGWENTLWGFQSQFFFMLLFTCIAMHFFNKNSALSMDWFFGFTFSMFAFFSTASGGLGFLAMASLHILKIITVPKVERDYLKSIVAIFLLLAAFALTYQLVPHISRHDPLKAQGVAEFLMAFLRTLSWPLPKFSLGLLVLNAPVFIFLHQVVINRENRDSPAWLFLGLAGWVWLQILAMSYSRGAIPIASRYTDLIMLNLLVNLAALLSLRMQSAPHYFANLFFISWLVTASYGLSTQVTIASDQFVLRGERTAVDELRIRGFLQTGNPSMLSSPPGISPNLIIPHPSPKQLEGYLTDPTLTSILPSQFNRGDARHNELLIFHGYLTRPVTRLVDIFLSLSWGLFLVAGSLFLTCLLIPMGKPNKRKAELD